HTALIQRRYADPSVRTHHAARQRHGGSVFLLYHTSATDSHPFPYTTLFRSPNTPDILHATLQQGGPPAFKLRLERGRAALLERRDRKSTRLNSSHLVTSYAVFCLKKKKTAGLSRLRSTLQTSAETISNKTAS